MRKICVITGARSEYGILSGLLRLMQVDPDVQLQLVVTNMHLRPEFGNTYLEIEKDGFVIDKKVDMPCSSDSCHGIVSSMSDEMRGMNDALMDLAPDILLAFGDRYEMLIAVIVGVMHRIPVAHIGGGNITQGALDDCIRHSITKMSSLHFTSTVLQRNRVIQLGELPERVYHVGSLGIENIKKTPLLSIGELKKDLNFDFSGKAILVTYHPATLSSNMVEDEIICFLSALDEMEQLKVIFTLPNSDMGSSSIIAKINNFVSVNPQRAVVFPSLGKLRYLSLMQHVSAVVGNSSSGLIEAPSFGIPTLDIGDRQLGREHGASVYHCTNSRESIIRGLNYVMSAGFRKIAMKKINPYEKSGSSIRILNILKNYPLKQLTSKTFYDINKNEV